MNEESKRTLALGGVLAALALLLVLGGASAAALGPQAIITVCPPPGAGCDYTTIQAAINNAGAGDTIRIAAGTYTENLTVTLPITLEGAYSGPPDWTRSLTLQRAARQRGGLGDGQRAAHDRRGRRDLGPAL